MSKIINVVDKNNRLVASISNENIILHNDYTVVETNSEDACLCDVNGEIKVLKPEGSA